jgi:hypothetical protein
LSRGIGNGYFKGAAVNIDAFPFTFALVHFYLNDGVQNKIFKFRRFVVYGDFYIGGVKKKFLLVGDTRDKNQFFRYRDRKQTVASRFQCLDRTTKYVHQDTCDSDDDAYVKSSIYPPHIYEPLNFILHPGFANVFDGGGAFQVHDATGKQ